MTQKQFLAPQALKEFQEHGFYEVPWISTKSRTGEIYQKENVRVFLSKTPLKKDSKTPEKGLVKHFTGCPRGGEGTPLQTSQSGKTLVESGVEPSSKMVSFETYGRQGGRNDTIFEEGVGSPSDGLGQYSEVVQNRVIDFLSESEQGLATPSHVDGVFVNALHRHVEDDFEKQFPSVAGFRSEGHSLVVCVDVEWNQVDEVTRDVISYQFACLFGGYLWRFVYFVVDSTNLPALDECLGHLLEALDVPYVVTNKRRKICTGLRPNGSLRWKSVTLTRYESVYKYGDETYPIARNEDGRWCVVRPLEIVKSYLSKLGFMSDDVSAGRYIFETAPELAGLIRDGGLLTIGQLKGSGLIDLYARGSDLGYSHSAFDDSGVERFPVTLLGHYGIVDFTAFHENLRRDKLFVRYLSSVNKGVYNVRGLKRDIPLAGADSVKRHRLFPVMLTVADSMLHAPAGGKALASLGKAVGYDKVDDERIDKSDMRATLEKHPGLFIDYASVDTVVPLLHLGSLYGFNGLYRPTVTGAGAVVAHRLLAEQFGLDVTQREDCKTFDALYRGVKVDKSTDVSDDFHFTTSTRHVAINDDARYVHQASSDSYRGGFNACFTIGAFMDGTTFDYDLANAYPTALTAIPDIDWYRPILKEFPRGHVFTLDDWRRADGTLDPTKPIFACVSFEFPAACGLPSLPFNYEGRMVNLLSSLGISGDDADWQAGPELFLAVQLGATVTAVRGIECRPLMKGGEVSRSIGAVLNGLVRDRARAVKGTTSELVLKLVANGAIYGKTAQGVVKSRTFDGMNLTSELIGPSVITNPVYASLCTSLVRACLIATYHDVTNAGYTYHSCTTDGFISDVPLDVLKSFTMFGFGDVLREARLFLTDGKNPVYWEEKHRQERLLNLATRANVGFEEGGVLAHGGFRTAYLKDSLSDRREMLDLALGRVGKLEMTDMAISPYRDVVLSMNNTIAFRETTRRLSLDFDMKRAPLLDGRKEVTVNLPEETLDDVVFSKASYDITTMRTRPFKDIAEARLWYSAKESSIVPVLREEADWNLFQHAVKAREEGVQAYRVDSQRTKVLSALKAYRLGLVKIEKLDGLKGAKLLAYVNDMFVLDKPITADDWKNLGRKSRASQRIPLELLMNELTVLGAEILRDSYR